MIYKIAFDYSHLDKASYSFLGSPFEMMKANYRTGGGSHWKYCENKHEFKQIPWNINLIYEL